MATLTVYPDPDVESTSVDGYVGSFGNNVVWSTIRSSSGNFGVDNGTGESFVRFRTSTTLNQWDTLQRGFFLFDTSALTSAANISSAVMSLYIYQKFDGLSATPDIDIYSSNPASNTALVSSDFQTVGSTSFTGSAMTYASITTGAYNDFTFNSTGIAAISKTGISKFATRNANYEVANVAPPWVSSTESNIVGNFADQAGTVNDPKLVITYTALTNEILPKNNLRPRIFGPGLAR